MQYAELYNSALKYGYNVEILATTIVDPRKIEAFFQRYHNVVKSNLYFNKAIATTNNNFSALGYGVYKSAITGKIIKLTESEVTTEYSGCQSGYHHTKEGKGKISLGVKASWARSRRLEASAKTSRWFLNNSNKEKT